MARLLTSTLSRRGLRRITAGVSLLEVLFAILITSIGLMGAIAIFPAAMSQARRGAQADASAAAGSSLVHAFDAQGMRQASRWMAYNGSAYATVGSPDGTKGFCIDPRFVAYNSNNTNANYFPFGQTGSQMFRVTLNNGGGGAMNQLLANLNFQLEDDIAFDRFRDGIVARDNTLQAASIFERGSSNNALKRQSNGHFSWMATLSPKLERLPTGGALEDRYILSIVVFHDRPGDLTQGSGRLANEWPLKIVDSGAPNGDFYDDGIGGGSVRLTDQSSEAHEERVRRLDVRPGQWIMLMGATNGTDAGGTTRTMPMCRWYRVVEADEPDETNYTVDVTLAGADWEHRVTTTPRSADVVVCQGVMAVFEKTIKLEPRQ